MKCTIAVFIYLLNLRGALPSTNSMLCCVIIAREEKTDINLLNMESRFEMLHWSLCNV